VQTRARSRRRGPELNPSPAVPGLPSHLLSLLRPEAYPHPVTDLRLIETHISWVLLTGEFAYKLKRPVHYSFVDLRSAERREFLCREEVRLNRRFAPHLYLGVSNIVAAGGGVRIADDGQAVEHAVRMRQFDVEEGLDRLIDSGRIVAGELEDFGRDLASIHSGLPCVGDSQSWGTVESVRAQVRVNLAECRELAAACGTGSIVDAIAQPLEELLRRLEPEISTRRAQRHVRECHGDLHARNLVRYEGRLSAFDCIEFEPAFRWIDIADELSFLWMDLGALRRADLALAFLSGYLQQGGDFGLCRLLPMYGSHRALVRAKIAALEHRDASPSRSHSRAASLELHRTYLARAGELLTPRRPPLVLMSGLSGSGKTWLARRLAPRLGAIHLRSDLERKRMAGLAPAADSHSAPGHHLYSPESSAHVYQHLAQCADAVLEGGIPVIVDATFARRAERARFRELARRRGNELIVVRCGAPPAVLRARISERRERERDASEADLAVLEWQQAHAEPIAVDESLDAIPADTTRGTVVDETLAAIAARLAGQD
jgi:aminoglycoside phosphotransferase family enzyme/predicted kinase